MSKPSVSLTTLDLGPRLGLLLGIAVGTALLAFLGFVAYSVDQSATELEQRGELLASTVGQQASYELLMGDHRALEETLAPVIEERSALAGGFYDKEGERVASTHLDSILSSEAHDATNLDSVLSADAPNFDERPLQWVETASHGTVLVATAEVRQGDSPVGSILTVLPTEALRAQKWTSYYLLGAVLVVVLSIGAFVMWQVRRTVEDPVEELRNAAREVESGNLDVQVSARQDDEIGELASSFNEMVRASREKTEQLEQQSRQAEEARAEAETLRQNAEAERESLRERFSEISGVLEAVEQGDLTQRLEAGSDDAVGTLKGQINTMIDQLASLIREIESTSTQLSNAAQTTTTAVEQLSEGAEDQADQTTGVATAIEEMTSTVKSSTEHAERSNEQARRAAELAADGEKVFQKTTDGMRRIADIVNTSADNVKELGAASAEIGDVVQVIEDIADRTNLLALNAAIEAARAGKEGDGFAVVANEVRELAERTTSATQEITEIVTQIQERIDDVVDSMERGTDEVEHGLTLAKKASDSFDEIVEAISKVEGMIDQIATATQQQSSTANQIAESVDSISTVADEVSASSRDLASMSENMVRQAGRLHERIEQFTLSGTEGGGTADTAQRMDSTTHLESMDPSDPGAA